MYLQYPIEPSIILYKKDVNSGLHTKQLPFREAVLVWGAYRESNPN